ACAPWRVHRTRTAPTANSSSASTMHRSWTGSTPSGARWSMAWTTWTRSSAVSPCKIPTGSPRSRSRLTFEPCRSPRVVARPQLPMGRKGVSPPGSDTAMRTDLFAFDLSEDRIALEPASPRDSARLLVVHPGPREHDLSLEDRVVRDLPDLVRP